MIGASTVAPMFTLLALMLVGAVFVSLVLLRLRQSLLVAYFLCGLAIANFGLLNAIAGDGAGEAIATMSEVGVMLLLFVLGMEFSLGELKHLRRYAFVGGAAQMIGTMLCVGGLCLLAFHIPWRQALVISVAVALSSTAISVKLYHDMGIAAGSGARFALGVAIFQDIFIIAFLVLLPALFAVTGGTLSSDLLLTLGRGAAFVGVSAVLARFVIPRVLRAVANTRSRELFTITVAGLCIGVAFLAALMGLSLVLGAFVAGLAVSESIYKHRILAEISPIKDLFLTIFFISVGLGVNLPMALENWQLITLVALGMLVLKAGLLLLIARALGLTWKAATVAAIGLGSAGEFSLVLMGKTARLTEWPDGVIQSLSTAMAISMASVPALMTFAQPIGDFLERQFPRKRVRLGPDEKPAKKVKALADHAIICGYGPVGRDLATALDREGIPALVIDLNADTIHDLLSDGLPALFADATQPEVWDLAALPTARLVAFTFPASPVIAGAIRFVRERNNSIPVLVRTKFATDAEAMTAAGADIVILDEEESGRAVIQKAFSVYNFVQVGGPNIVTK